MAAKRAPAVLLLPSFALGVQPPAMLSPLCRDGAGADSLLCPHPPEPNPMAELLLDPKALAVTLPAPAQSMAPRRGGPAGANPAQSTQAQSWEGPGLRNYTTAKQT